MIDAPHRIVLVGRPRVDAPVLAARRAERGAIRHRVRIEPRADRRVHRAVPRRRRRHGKDVREPEALVQPFVGGEEERLVADHRPAGREAELIALERRLLHVEEVPRVERVVAVELERRSVQRVGARLSGGIDHAARVVAVLRAEAVGQHLELANGLDAEDVARRAPGLAELIVQVRPVEREQIRGVARAVHAQLRAEAGGRSLAAGLRQLHAGRERRELHVAPAVERQPLDLLLGNEAAGRRRFQIDGRRFADDGDLI